MIFFIALLVFIAVYSVVKFLLGKVASLSEVAEVLAIVIGALAGLWYAGAI